VNDRDDASVDRLLDNRRDEFSGANERRRIRAWGPTWEYMTWIVEQQSPSTWVVIYVNGEPERRASNALPAALAQAGTVGWDLVAVHSTEKKEVMYVFKRPKADD
jgi:hypothetical protein